MTTIGRTILVVDDDPLARLERSRILSEDGHRVDTADGPEIALAKLALGRYDLLLSDVSMPEGSEGLRLAMEVRLRWPGTQIVLVTGFGEEAVEFRATELGVQDFLRRPVKREHLLAVVRRWSVAL